MEKNVLSGYQTFLQHPDYYLLVNSNSNYFYIEKANENFIATRMSNVVMEKTNGFDCIVTTNNYYSVIDGSCVHKDSAIYSIIDNKENIFYDDLDDKVYLLSDILNISGNKKSYLNMEDIDTIVNYEKEEPKVYKKK
ncbi:MAG: hypothetical protein IJY25_01085 [Bacilli bacterium]|nr:hypothetical protein [Bacilli bacterium]